MRYRRIVDRGSREGGKHRRLFNVELLQILAEVILRRRGETVLTVAHEMEIAVHRQDLRLRVVTLDLNREHRLLDLAAETPLRRQKQVFAQLLSERAAAFNDATRHEILQTCPSDSIEI